MISTFKACQPLVDLLLKYGFTDHTAELYPSHYQRMRTLGYDPYTIKRIFRYHTHDDYIIFNYVNISIHHKGAFNHTEERLMLTEKEARSLITFYKLPRQVAIDWLDAYKNALDLHKYYNKICELPEMFSSEMDKRIKETFERVLIKQAVL